MIMVKKKMHELAKNPCRNIFSKPLYITPKASQQPSGTKFPLLLTDSVFGNP